MSRILTLTILIVGLIVGVYLIGQETGFFSKAAISDVPTEVKISNLSDNSFTVSWVTGLAVPGFVQYGQGENLDKTVLDDRDTGAKNARFTHYVTLKGLEPATSYSFKIGSGKGIYDNQGKLYTQTTAPTTKETPPLADPLFGQVVKEDGKVPGESIVYLQPEKGTLLSSFIREDGNFLITLTNARDESLSSYLTFDVNRKIKLSAQAGDEGLAQLDLNFNNRVSAQKLVLQKPVNRPAGSATDLNGDGVINAVDFAIYVKKKVGL